MIDKFAKSIENVKGRITTNHSLSKMTWFGVGGAALLVIRPQSPDDLARLLTQTDSSIPILTIGVGSNLLISDQGFAGIVIRLGREFAHINVEGTNLRVGAAALDVNVAKVAQNAGLEGLEFLCGIPGTIGGAVVMNGGAYGSEISNLLITATIIDRNGNYQTLSNAQINYSYRKSELPIGCVVIEALLRGSIANDPALISQRMANIIEQRQDTQPLGVRTGGSTFKNPALMPAWKLIDIAGCRGLRKGGAVVSEKHCNFLINEGGATAAELEWLGETIREKVQAQSGILLEWEIIRIGSDNEQQH